MFGNRIDDGAVVNAPGVRAEFDLARAAGLIPLPVGGTGYMSRELHDEVMGQLPDFYGEDAESIRPLLATLAEPSEQLTTYIDPVLQIVDILRGGE